MPRGKKLSKTEREYYYAAISFLDNNSEYVICDVNSDTLSYTSKIYSGETITGRPSDEELTRALVLVNLIKKYGYSHKNLILEDSVEYSGRNITNRAFQNDIAILDDDNNYKSLIEVKRIADFVGVGDIMIYNQLFHPFNNFAKYSTVTALYYVTCDVPISQDSFPLICIGIDTKKVKTYDEWINLGKPTYYIDILNNNSKDIKITNYRKLSAGAIADIDNKDLNDNFTVDTIRRVWRNIWDAIWGGTLESNTKFENFNKILLAKIYDERKTYPGTYYTFQRKIRAGELQTNLELAYDIDLLYRKAYVEYFSKDNTTDLKDVKGIDFEQFSIDLIAVCVEELYRYSFAGNRYKNVDILGEFYEMVIRDSFKQTKGLFLTHPNIVLFILEALDVRELVKNKLRFPDEDARYRLPFVIDPSCGTGTFLVYYMNLVQKYVSENAENISNGDIDVDEFIRREMLGENTYKWVKDYVFGMDIEPTLSMASQINQILHGDGSTNIYCADGLANFDDYSELDVVGAHNILSTNIKQHEYYGNDSIEKFDIIISNPPFNVNINKTAMKNRFEISGKSEAFFLERWYQLLKPKGRIGVVLPESFFSVEDDSPGRIFLYKHFNIKFIVSLPNFTFLPHTNTSTSLLFAEKKSSAEENEFSDLWEGKNNLFDSISGKIFSLFIRPKEITTQNMKNVFENVIQKTETELGEGFVVFPYFPDDFFADIENYDLLKRKTKNVIINSKERWMLREICSQIGHEKFCFDNYAVDNIGYKAGKKGAKDKPNELISVYDAHNKQIYNIKYAHDWDMIKTNDLETVLGLIRRDNPWQ